MPSGAQRVFDEAMQLSRKERLALAAQLLASVRAPGRALSGAPWEAAVRKELDRRWADAERTGDWGEPWSPASPKQRSPRARP